MSSEDTIPSTNSSSTPTAPIPPRVLTGGCMCKSIRYKIARDECQERMHMSMSSPSSSKLTTRCHCGGCQAVTSSAFSIGLVVPAQSFQLDDPDNLLKIYEDSDSETLVGNRIAFCSKCGCYLLHEPVCILWCAD